MKNLAIAQRVVEVLKQGRSDGNIGGITVRDVQTVSAQHTTEEAQTIIVGGLTMELLMEELMGWNVG